MNKEEKFLLVKELNKLQIPIKKQEQIFIEKTKNHRATFYRYRKKLNAKEFSKSFKVSKPFKYLGKDLGRCYFCLKKAKIIHHISSDRQDNRKENLLPLCRGCHEKLHRVMVNFKDYLLSKHQ